MDMVHSLFSNTPDPVGDPITGITTVCVCAAVTAPTAELSADAWGKLVGVPTLAPPDLVL